MSINGGSPNILLIIADDLGLDVVKDFGTGSSRTMDVVTCDDDDVKIRGHLETISRFLRNGLFFKQAWAQPACSPTRASIYTGLHPWKHGVGSPSNPELSASTSLTTLPEVLPTDYVCGLFGKWHLGDRPGTYPTDHGWDRYQGALGGALGDYNNWPRVSDPTYYTNPTLYETGHASWVTVRDAAGWINDLDQETPWFVTIAFNAPHEPFHVPWFPGNPGAGIGFDPATPGDPTSAAYMFNVMTQNMDHNIGRLIGTVSGSPAGTLEFDPIPSDQLDNTIIIFLGDNGSPAEVAKQEPKTEVYEGGILVPMIVADGRAVLQEILGFGISPLYLNAEKLNVNSRHLVHVVDLYKTIGRLADPSSSGFPSNSDSHDLGPLFKNPGDHLPVRRYNFSQWFNTQKEIATVRNLDYKLNYDSRTAPDYYSLYRYERNRVPGREDDIGDILATNLIDVAISGEDAEANENLNELMAEITSNYQVNPNDTFLSEP